MDPSVDFVTIKSSFGKKKAWSDKLLPPVYRNKTPNSIKQSISTLNVDNLPAIYCDQKTYKELQSIQDQFNEMDNYKECRDKTLPITSLGNSIYMDRAGVKIANLDALYNISQTNQQYDQLQHPGEFTFCDIAAGPGAFSEYMLWRRYESRGYGMTLYMQDNKSRLNWDLTRLGPRFDYTNGDDGTGDLYTQWPSFVRFVKDRTSSIDLVMGDGGFDLEGKQENFQRQEFLSSRLLLTQILTAISVLSHDGNFICKVFDTVTTMSAQLLYICSLCFDNISVVKLMSSRWANSERYIVARKFKNNASLYIDLLSEANKHYTTTDNVVQLFSNEMPEDFVSWMKSHNNFSIDLQTKYSKAILDYASLDINKQALYVAQPRINLTKCFIIWNIPSNKVITGTKNVRDVYNRYMKISEVQKWFREKQATNIAWVNWLILYHSFATQTDVLAFNEPDIEIKKYVIELFANGNDMNTEAMYNLLLEQSKNNHLDHNDRYVSVRTKRLYEVIRLTINNISFDVHQSVYDNLRLRYDYQDNDIDQQIWDLLGTYSFIDHPPYQRSFIGDYINVLHEKLEISTEWFASPMNAYAKNYYSLFPNDVYFGKRL